MPVYQYRDTKNGELVELVRSVALRDQVPPNYQRVTVPQRIAISGAAADPRSADSQVPRAFRQLEEKVGAREIVREGGWTVDQVKKIWNI